MECNGRESLQRTSSQASTASNRSRKSGTVRMKPRKHLSSTSVTPVPTPVAGDPTKSLTSFPSLSPEDSPEATRDRPNLASHISQDRRPAPRKSSIVESLITTTSSFRGRSALFEDSPRNKQDVPGALHLASDEHIKRLVAKTGAIALVRQLAEDLALRDAEITGFRRRAEERERELKKMLREVEVSNLDIEKRLHQIGNPLKDSVPAAGQQVLVMEQGRRESEGKLAGATNGIDAMVGDAMMDEIGLIDELDEGYMDTLEEQNWEATIKAAAVPGKGTDRRSISSSLDSQGRTKDGVKGWKDYLWNGAVKSRNRSRASSAASNYHHDAGVPTRAQAPSGVSTRRKGLNEDLFQPPPHDSALQKPRDPSINIKSGSDIDSHSRKSSVSIASWTLKLFAGNPQAGRESEIQQTVRGRSATTSHGALQSSRNHSTASTATTSSATAALMKVNSRSSNMQPTRKSALPIALGPSGTLKAATYSSGVLVPGSPLSADTASNLGPVEMDTILPPDSRPPTLTQSDNINQPAEFLTDRFGFIYDQRRKKKELDALSNVNSQKHPGGMEMLSSARDPTEVVESGMENGALAVASADLEARPETPTSTEDKANGKPTKRWQDYLKAATFPTELLSHTPSSGAIVTLGPTDVKRPLRRAPTLGDNGASHPSTSVNPQPLASSVTAGNAEIAKPFLAVANSPQTTVKAEAEPVQMLLAKLTEVHDSLQRDKTVKWNEFLRKVRAERKREGEAIVGTDLRSKQAFMPEATIADGELIGVAGLGNKGKVGRAKWKEFKQLVLAGIPVAYRAKVWAECSGASAMRVPGYYDDLVSNGVDDPEILAQIQMDINRTLTDNVFFRKGPGVAKLNEVLLAYSRRNPEVGYCQGMNLITASLLLIMPTTEDAFWILASMIENTLPRHYYDQSLIASRADQQVLRQYVAKILPRLSAHLDDLGIELEALTFQWFLSLFTDCLSAEALFRVWDVVLCFNDGSTFLFQVALALLKLNEGSLMECDTPAEVYAYINHEMTNHAISIDGLIQASDGLKNAVTRQEVEERREQAIEAEKETTRRREAGREGKRDGGAVRGNEEIGVGKGEDGVEDEADGTGDLKVQTPRPIDEDHFW
ncbi:Rab-GTPase-TBC domain [Lasallia pustulata]|uniref:Rab-GTPase-TBC domain n=1 Tax=Lasallia pustulata TaxID=136370 RepID=A0A1W5DB03_9LECA|nr:Rab-GTPase-TBC domain [Lasallia pustulata]